MRKALLIMGLAVAVFAVGCSDNSSNNGGSGDRVRPGQLL